MAYNNFKPTLWSGIILASLRKSHVFGQMGVINRNYEGEIRDAGDRVKINTLGRPTVKDYVPNTDMDGAEQLPSAEQYMLIDTAKYVNFAVDDVDAAQANVNLLAGGLAEASYEFSDVSDKHIAAKMVDAIGKANTLGGTGTTISGTAAYEQLVGMGVRLDENNVPGVGRWVIVPPWFHGELQKDSRFVHATPRGDDVLTNGVIGAAAGFTVLKSNNVVNNGTLFRVVAGHGIATTHAEQIAKMEAYRIEKQFGDGVKGLHVYGTKVIRPSALVMLNANRPS